MAPANRLERDSEQMTHQVPIAIAAGVLSAIVFVSVAIGQSALGLLLAAIMPLPILMVGLVHGWTSAAIAGLAATALIFVIGGAGNAAAFALSHAAPAAGLSYLTLLNRPGDSGAGPDGAPETEWYPTGRLVLACALIGAALSLALIQYLGGTPEALKTTAATAIKSIVDTLQSTSPEFKVPTEAEQGEMAEGLAAILPASFAVTVALLFMFNLWLAARLTRNAGLARPWPDLTLIAFPRGTAFAFAVATAASLMEGRVGMAGMALSGVLLLAFLLAGLAIVHNLSRGQPWRVFALIALYLSLLINPLPISINPVPLLLAALGLADTVFSFRRKPPGPAPT